MQTTACTPREVCLILWVKYSQFFAFIYPFTRTIATMFSSPVMFYFGYYSCCFFCSSKNSRNSSSSRLTDCSLSMLQDGGTSCLSHSLSTPPQNREKIFNDFIRIKKIERLLGSIHYISHSVSMPFAHDQYTINRLIIGYHGNITRLSVAFTLVPAALMQMLADRLTIFCGIL